MLFENSCDLKNSVNPSSVSPFYMPGAMIGFAGPRVVKETIRKELPDGFQSAEQTLENGFLDMIVHRKDLKHRIGDLLMLFKN